MDDTSLAGASEYHPLGQPETLVVAGVRYYLRSSPRLRTPVGEDTVGATLSLTTRCRTL